MKSYLIYDKQLKKYLSKPKDKKAVAVYDKLGNARNAVRCRAEYEFSREIRAAKWDRQEATRLANDRYEIHEFELVNTGVIHSLQ
jgi:hypothetical protein